MECKYCGCTDKQACTGGCSWAEDNVCSNCVCGTKTIKKELEAYLSDPEVVKIEIVITNLAETERRFLVKNNSKGGED